jgi:hypothetical protein
LKEDQIKVKNLGGPCIEEHEIGFLPGIIETEGRKIFLDFRGRELSSSEFAIALNKVFVDGSGIPRGRMSVEEDKAIRSLDLLFKNAEDNPLLLLK